MQKKYGLIKTNEKIGLDSALMEDAYLSFATQFRTFWKDNAPVDSGRLREFFFYRIKKAKKNASVEISTMPYLESNPSLEGAEKMINEEFFKLADTIIEQMLNSKDRNLWGDLFGIEATIENELLNILDKLKAKIPNVEIYVKKV